jgi:aryl-alcohol dehydrogenase-like predicted oxidoreductase
MLGETLKSIDVSVVTKAERRPFSVRVLLLLRGMAKRFLAHSSQARAAVAAARPKPLPSAYTPKYLRRALLGSLGRLQREQADIFLLHSPIAADLADGAASNCLGALKQEGLGRCVGVSCEIKQGWPVSLPTSALKQLRLRLVQTVKTCSLT